ncbi:CBO0543 family protein [Clostridium aciditolerans]|uniref:Uncharacterized protein n=1 Tax=Clostridium aciditolerans TaxID=339861 RepID=A0A934I1E7_9CLOT|nr:CBO0543 family protein [Clostridium aciditolerans]MBI6873281.1 hypothetical protein [Clostridium aciditolerans]
MILNIIAGFIIPWLTGIILYSKDKRLLLITAPFQSSMAFAINVIGYNKNYWNLYPFELEHISAIPFDTGLYPILGVWMLYLIKTSKLNAYFIILFFTIATTFLEFLGIVTGRVFYAHGWNIFYTFLSYLLPYVLAYLYYLCLKNNNVFN